MSRRPASGLAIPGPMRQRVPFQCSTGGDAELHPLPAHTRRGRTARSAYRARAEASHGWHAAYTHPVALDMEVQRLQIEDVLLVDLPDQDAKVEAKVVRDIERTSTSVIVTLRVAGRDDFVREWPLGELVTVLRGP
jgi:hypothetical protein